MNTTSVAKLNSAAISFMQQGDFASAIVVLKRALAIMRSSLHTNVARVSNPCKIPPRRHAAISSSVPTVDVHKTKADVFEVFPRAFHLPVHQTHAGVDYDSLTSLALLYNMGLSYQLSALATGCSNQLRTAREVYKMALSVVQGCLGSALTDSCMLLQLLALFNNMGNLHSTCYDADATNQCINALTALLESRTFGLARNGEGAELFRFFEWNNTLATSNPLFAFAPAA